MGIGTWRTLAAGRPVLRQRDALVLGFGDAAVCDQMPSIQLNLDLVFGFAYFHAAPDPVHRNRVAVVSRPMRSIWRLAWALPGGL